MPRGVAKIDQASTRKEHNRMPIWKNKFVHLRFDVDFLDSFVFFQFFHLNFIVKMSNVANNRFIFHFFHVLNCDDVTIPSGGHKNIGLGQRIFHSFNFKAFHGSLQGANWINFGDNHASAKPFHALSATFSHVAITANHYHFASHHHIRAPLDAIGQTFAATIKIVKFAFGHRIVHIDRWKQQSALLKHLIKPMHARGGFFRNSFKLFEHLAPKLWILFVNPGQYFQQFFFIFTLASQTFFEQFWIFFSFHAKMQHQGGVAAIIHNQIRSQAAFKFESLLGAPPVFFQRFAFPSKH